MSSRGLPPRPGSPAATEVNRSSSYSTGRLSTRRTRSPGGTSTRGIGAGSRWPATPVPPDRLPGRGGVAIAEEWQPLVVVDAGALGTAAPAGRVPWTDVADSPAAADLQALEPTPDTLVEASKDFW